MYTSFQGKMILEKLLYAEVFESYRKEYYSILSDKAIISINYNEEQLTHNLWFNLHLRVNSYLQHYHQLSPMLDFTSGFDIALYFAFCGVVSTNENVSLFIINSKHLTTEKEFKKSVCFSDMSTCQNPNGYSDLLLNSFEERKRVFDNNQHLFEKVYSLNSEHVLLKPSVSLYNKKIKAQKGLLLFYKPHLEADKASPFEDIYIKATKERITCLNININLIQEVLEYLNKKQITENNRNT
jgi:hypothetical protein